MQRLTLRSFQLICGLLPLLALACAPPAEEVADAASPLDVHYEKYSLDNGLEVVLHIDRSDPIAAVAMTFHVGSAREIEGRTGFAHLFEHLFFLDSENLGPGGLDQLMAVQPAGYAGRPGIGVKLYEVPAYARSTVD